MTKLCKPYRQGHLDHLCGLYAAINAIRLTVDDAERFSGQDCLELYQSLIKELDGRRMLGRMIAGGQNLAQMRQILGLAREMMLDRYEFAFEYRALFRSGRKTTKRELLSKISRHLARKSGAVLMRLSEHWSVVDRVAGASLRLFDSWRVDRVWFVDCVIDDPRKSKARDLWDIQPRAIILLTYRADTPKPGTG